MSDEAVRYRTSDYSTFPSGNSHTSAGGTVRVKAVTPTATTRAGAIAAYEPVAIVPGSATAPDSVQNVFTSTDAYSAQVLTIGVALEAGATADAPKMVEVAVAGPTKASVRHASTAAVAAGSYVRILLDNGDGKADGNALALEAATAKKTAATVGYLMTGLAAVTAAATVVADVFLLGESVVPATQA